MRTCCVLTRQFVEKSSLVALNKRVEQDLILGHRREKAEDSSSLVITFVHFRCVYCQTHGQIRL